MCIRDSHLHYDIDLMYFFEHLLVLDLVVILLMVLLCHPFHNHQVFYFVVLLMESLYIHHEYHNVYIHFLLL